MDLKAEDLINECKKCNGSGYFKDRAIESTGARMSWSREGPCDECGGAGGELTEGGEAVAKVIRFMRKQGRL